MGISLPGRRGPPALNPVSLGHGLRSGIVPVQSHCMEEIASDLVLKLSTAMRNLALVCIHTFDL